MLQPFSVPSVEVFSHIHTSPTTMTRCVGLRIFRTNLYSAVLDIFVSLISFIFCSLYRHFGFLSHLPFSKLMPNSALTAGHILMFWQHSRYHLRCCHLIYFPTPWLPSRSLPMLTLHIRNMAEWMIMLFKLLVLMHVSKCRSSIIKCNFPTTRTPPSSVTFFKRCVHPT